MQSVTSIYLHGFLSSGQSQKGQWFLQQMIAEQQGQVGCEPSSKPDSKYGSKVDLKDEVAFTPIFKDWLTPTYPIGSPKMTIESIEKLLVATLQQTDQVILVGSSMGGFYAQYFGQKYKLPYVMINPALNPKPLFTKEKGARENPVTGEQLVIDDAYIADLVALKPKVLDRTVPALLLIEEGDDVIDIPFALQHYQQAGTAFKTVVYPGGEHAFINVEAAWQEIKQFVAEIA